MPCGQANVCVQTNSVIYYNQPASKLHNYEKSEKIQKQIPVINNYRHVQNQI